MDSTSPEVISEIEAVLERKLSSTVTQDYTETGGVDAVVEVLNGVDRSTEKTILDALEIQDPELAEEIRKRMFVFEDIVTLDNRSIQRIVRDCENEDLILVIESLKRRSERSIISKYVTTDGGIIPGRDGNYGTCSVARCGRSTVAYRWHYS